MICAILICVYTAKIGASDYYFCGAKVVFFFELTK